LPASSPIRLTAVHSVLLLALLLLAALPSRTLAHTPAASCSTSSTAQSRRTVVHPCVPSTDADVKEKGAGKAKGKDKSKPKRHRRHHARTGAHGAHGTSPADQDGNQGPGQSQIPSSCEDGSSPEPAGGGSFACDDGSEPSCEDGSSPFPASHGSALVCDAASGSGSKPVCEDGSLPTMAGSESYSCDDGSEPICEDGSSPFISTDGSTLLCSLVPVESSVEGQE